MAGQAELAFDGEIMNKETILNLWKESSIKQKILAIGVVGLLSIGVLGAMGEFSSEKRGGVLSGIAETIGLKKKSSNGYDPANPQSGTPQLSKEYIYAGSRMLATEDYGIAPSSTSAQNNLALGKTAQQSTTANDWVAARATDGNTDGVFGNNSVTHTAGDAQPWWQVDLGSYSDITQIKIWNRTDCCMERLSNLRVFVSDVPFTSNDYNSNQAGMGIYNIPGAVGNSITIDVNRTGRYIRVQLAATDYLSLAEVQVFGTVNPNPPPQPPATPTITSITANADPTCLNLAITPVNGAVSYNVRLVANGYTINVLQASFPWCGLSPSTSYQFEAQAVNNIGASGWSATVGGTTGAPIPQPPPTPTITSVTANADPTCLNIAINPVNGAASYNVRLAANGYTINVLQASFPWCGLSPNTYYEYQAQAVNNVGASGWSAAVGGTTAVPAPPLSATVTVSPLGPRVGDSITINWSTNQVRPTTDYVALYRGATLVTTRNIAGGTSGNILPIEMNTMGTYTVKYFVQGNPNPITTSEPFIVRAPR